MSLLLDTHAALWYALGDAKLSASARAAIEAESQRFISPASYWEIAIKVSMKAYQLTIPFDQFWKEVIQRCGYVVLPIEVAHAARLVGLPRIHKDPFDRMLVAQGLAENLPVISCDEILDGYGIRRIW